MAKKDTYNYNTATLKKAIAGSGGLYSVIAKRLGCAWHTAKKYVEANKTARQLILNEEESILDLAESKLIENIKDNDNTAIALYLKSKGAKRGYAEVKKQETQQEITVSLDAKTMEIFKKQTEEDY